MSPPIGKNPDPAADNAMIAWVMHGIQLYFVVGRILGTRVRAPIIVRLLPTDR